MRHQHLSLMFITGLFTSWGRFFPPSPIHAGIDAKMAHPVVAIFVTL